MQTDWNFYRKTTKSQLTAMKNKVKINEKFEIHEINFNLDSQQNRDFKVNLLNIVLFVYFIYP